MNHDIIIKRKNKQLKIYQCKNCKKSCFSTDEEIAMNYLNTLECD